MKKQISRVSFVGLIGILCMAPSTATAKQVMPCTAPDLAALLQPTDLGYAEAAEFRQSLEAQGIIVRCVCRSKMTGMFEGQRGAAVLRTDQGDFEALFLPKSKNWAALEIIQNEKGGRYLCSARGHPKPWHTVLMDGSRPAYFVKHANQLCITWDPQLSAKLDQILNLN
jgi:hypothetical protein